jgi:hypothetical protein
MNAIYTPMLCYQPSVSIRGCHRDKSNEEVLPRMLVQKGSTRLRRLRKESNSQSMNMQKRESRHCES